MSTVMTGWTTLPTRQEAEDLARELVEKSLVACAQVEGPITSYYRWQGKVQSDEEYRINMKFSERHYDALEEQLKSSHPYDTPQWLAVQADKVLSAYEGWIHGDVPRQAKLNQS